MKTNHRPHIATLLAILMFLTAGACTNDLKEEVFGSPQAQINLLIAGDASAYKDLLRGKIIHYYQSRANIQVVNIQKLGQIAPENYHAILIMDTCLAWTHFNPTVLSFLEKPSSKKRVVWFMTVDDTEDLYQHNGVDAITAASVVEDQQRIITKLTQQIDTILSGKH